MNMACIAPSVKAIMLAEIMAFFKPEIGSLIQPSEAVEGVAESAAGLCHMPAAVTVAD
jgi:hypothetical protein